MPRIVVVGAGISGLALAHRLEQTLPAAQVVVLEERSRTGGTIETVRRDAFVVEAGPNGFPDNNPSTLDLARSIGLQDQLVVASEAAGRNRFLLIDGRLRLLPNSFGSFLKTDLLGWVAKGQLLLERFRPRRKGWRDESIHAFARRRVGRQVADTFVDAFVTGILAGDPRLLSVEASFPRLVGWERNFGSILAGMKHAAGQRRRREAERDGLSAPQLPSLKQWLAGLVRSGDARPSRRAGAMWSCQGGLGTLVETLSSRLRVPPVTGVAVRRVLRDGASWRVEGDGRDLWMADAVVLACPAHCQATLLADFDPAVAEQVGGIAYNRVAVVALGYRREQVPHSLDGFGYLSGQRSRRDVLGVQWCSSIFPDRAPSGTVLLRAMCGGWNRGDIVDWPDERLLRAVRDELAVTIGVRTPPLFHQIIRWHRAIPQYFLGHLERISWIEQRLASHPGLFVGGNAYRGVAMNDCVEQAGILAERVMTFIREQAPASIPGKR
jgi:oxygen-dependent protoporphyrinogen oxidase